MTEKEIQIALKKAITNAPGYAEKWEALSKEGASNSQIFALLRSSFGMGGGLQLETGYVIWDISGEMSISYAEGRWGGKNTPVRIEGLSLVVKARELFKIPYPTKEIQLSLIGEKYGN